LEVLSRNDGKIIIHREKLNQLSYSLFLQAASCFGNHYYFTILSNLFLSVGGDEKWLTEGPSAAPKKLRKIVDLNSCLAFCPWDIAERGILKDLLRCGGEDQWSVSELIHAMVILSFYHSWSCFAFSNGVNVEVDMETTFDCATPANSCPTSPTDPPSSKSINFLQRAFNREIIREISIAYKN
jgi:hypothetical protein